MIKTTTKLKKCFAVLRARMGVFNQCGQVAVFYALLIPIFLFVGGVGLDLGWYYLSVSRLQNAADASVLVGAKILTKTHDLFKNKSYKVQLVDKYPADDDHATNIVTTIGDQAALDYAKKNLDDNSTAYAPPSFFAVAQAADIKDGYTRGNNTVTMTTGLYQDGEDYFYVIGLSENIHHFFIGFLKDMNAGVVAVAKLEKNTDTEDTPTPPIPDPKKLTIILDANGGTLTDEEGNTGEKRKITIQEKKAGSDEYNDTSLPTNDEVNIQKEGYTFEGWYIQDNSSGKLYQNGDSFTSDEIKDLFGTKTEITLFAKWKENEKPHEEIEVDPDKPPVPHVTQDGKNIYLEKGAEGSDRTDIDHEDNDAKNNKTEHFMISENQLSSGDDLVIQFAYDVKNTRVTLSGQEPEWDLRMKSFTRGTTSGSICNNEDDNASNFRIHSKININAMASGNDPLYVLIKPEYSNLLFDYPKDFTRDKTGKYKQYTDYSSVRQIVININVDNTNGRPLIFIYDKPQMSHDSEEAKSLRAPLPIILNLNANFKGAVYAPNTSVVVSGGELNDNGVWEQHSLDGFIIAKDFVKFQEFSSSSAAFAQYGAPKICADHNKKHKLKIPVLSDYKAKNRGEVLYEPLPSTVSNNIESANPYHLSHLNADTFGLNKINLNGLDASFGTEEFRNTAVNLSLLNTYNMVHSNSKKIFWRTDEFQSLNP